MNLRRLLGLCEHTLEPLEIKAANFSKVNGYWGTCVKCKRKKYRYPTDAERQDLIVAASTWLLEPTDPAQRLLRWELLKALR